MPKRSLRPRAAGGETGLLDLERHVGDRLAPGQVGVDLLGRDLDAGIRRAAEPERRVGLLHRREEQLPALEPDVLALRCVDGLAGQQRAPDAQELVGDGVAGGVVEEQAVALELDRVAAGDHVDQQPAVRDPVERRRHARGHGGRLQARADGDQEAQPLGQRRQGRGDDPAVLAGAAGRQQHAVVAEIVGRLGDLAQIGEVDLPGALAGAEIAAVAMGRQEPEDVGVGGAAHALAFQTTSLTVIGLGSRPSAWKVSAICCCSAVTASSSGWTP